MTGARVVLIGGGEHARVVLEALRTDASAPIVLGYVDANICTIIEERDGLARLGTDAALADHPGVMAMLGFGATKNWAQRRVVAARLEERVSGWTIAVHRAAWVSPTARLGPGTVVLPGAVVHGGAVVGSHCVINSGAVVEHDCRVGDNVHVAPGAVLGGGAVVGEDSYIGLGARVRDHVMVGRGVLVAMSASVVGNVADGLNVAGVPARPAAAGTDAQR